MVNVCVCVWMCVAFVCGSLPVLPGHTRHNVDALFGFGGGTEEGNGFEFYCPLASFSGRVPHASLEFIPSFHVLVLVCSVLVLYVFFEVIIAKAGMDSSRQWITLNQGH